jgi:hypothetical protein
MDRAFIEDLGIRDQRGGLWDWEQRDRRGRAFTELQLIGFHTRATRLLDEAQTRWLCDQISPIPTRRAL